ncbi:MAG: transglutaminase family protein [Leptospirales bacterium]
MQFKIVHRMEFAFSSPVFFEPMTVRLHPRSDAAQTVRIHDLEVTPPPIRTTRILGLDGNVEEILWFSGLHRNLSVIASSEVRTHRKNPFDFLLTDSRAHTLPLVYNPTLSALLSPYLDPSPGLASNTAFRDFVDGIRRESGNEILPFLTVLIDHIRESFGYIVRESGEAHPPDRTLSEGKGSCRDFALLAIAACRACNIAARFTSGYHAPETQEEPDLHAWFEVYLPGAGWRGYDPSEGLMAADHHIALVSSALPALTLPTEGHFRGEGQSTLSPRITVERSEDPVPGPKHPTNDG